MLGESEKATESYWQAIQLDPGKGDLWFDLGTSYLQQVESDARLMTSAYGDSAYVKLRSAEVLAEEGKLIDAEQTYKAAIALPPPVPCRFAEFGITLLRQQKTSLPEYNSSTNAKRVLLADWRAWVWRSSMLPRETTQPRSPGSQQWRTPIPHLLFEPSAIPGALVTDQIDSLIRAAGTRPYADTSIDLAELIQSAFLSDEALPSLKSNEDGLHQCSSAITRRRATVCCRRPILGLCRCFQGNAANH